MKKLILFAIILVAVIFGIRAYLFTKTKAASPEAETSFKDEGIEINVLYNSPSKRGRTIFGGLVPYGKVWRTGANEATIFKTNSNLLIGGKQLSAGTYTLWTIPAEDKWRVIFNSETGQWGIDSNGNANRNPKLDALTIEVPVLQQDNALEKFTITVARVSSELQLTLAWDKTFVAIPLVISP